MISFGYVILSHSGHWSHLILCTKKREGLLWQIARKTAFVQRVFSCLFLPFLYALGSKPTNFMSTIILLDNPDINDQIISPPKFKDFKNKEGNYMGIQMSQNFPPDFVMIISERRHCYSLSLSQPKNFQICIRLRYIRSFCSNLPTIFGVSVFFALYLDFTIIAKTVC